MKPKKTVPDPSPEQIAALAHAIWVDRGCPEGREMDNWLEAERQLKGDVHQPSSADDLPASDVALDPDRALETDIEKELNRVVSPTQPRSNTSL